MMLIFRAPNFGVKLPVYHNETEIPSSGNQIYVVSTYVLVIHIFENV